MTNKEQAELAAAKKAEKPLTLEQRIEQLKAQQEQAKEVFIKCTGAIEVLSEMLNEK